jgi:hypothetical protein
MSTDLRYRPLDTWDGPHTDPDARSWPDYAATDERVDAELRRAFDHLGVTEAAILVDAPASAIRLDGFLRANANPGAAVALVMETTHGTLRFQCDRFHQYVDNLRCIAFTLDRLRLIDRDGCATGGQAYTGWQAIPERTGPAGMTRAEAARLLCQATADEVGEDPRDIEAVARVARSLYTEAAKRHHPDRGGEPGYLARLGQARDTLLAPLEIGAGNG